MCRLLGYCARNPTPLAGIIGEAGLRDFTALSAWHGDGWGMAWVDGRRIGIRKSPIRACDDPSYDELARQRRATRAALFDANARQVYSLSEGIGKQL